MLVLKDCIYNAGIEVWIFREDEFAGINGYNEAHSEVTDTVRGCMQDCIVDKVNAALTDN